MRPFVKILVGFTFLLLIPATLTFPTSVPAASRRGADVQIYSLQILVNNAYQMVLEGSSLVMLNQMDFGGVFGEMITSRGWTMIEQGQQIISEAMNGEDMKKLTLDGRGKDPLMLAVQENAAEILKTIDVIEYYLRNPVGEAGLSRMHSLFFLLNHGMKMATDGANLIILGRTGEQGGAKETQQKHGRTMMRDGRILIIRLSDNDTMRQLHQDGFTIERSPAMASLHKVIELSLRIIDRLSRT